MRLADGPRQLLAGLLAGVGFLVLFFGLKLVWWLALPLAVVAYFALILAIPRRRPLAEISLAASVSAADIAAARESLNSAADRLDRAAAEAPKGDAPVLEQMAGQLRAIWTAIKDDPQDFRAARSFIAVFLPKIVASVESYVKLTGEATGASADRVKALGESIHAFAPAISRIHAACIENDIHALEVEVSVLTGTLRA